MEATVFNRSIAGLKASESIALMDKARELKARGEKVVSLAGGEPDFNTPEAVILEAVKNIKGGDTHYVTGRGLVELRSRISRKLLEDNGVRRSADEILVTPGAKFAIYCAILTMINPGDEVLILEPAWLSYSSIVAIAGGVPVSVKLSYEDNYAITEDKLAAKVTPRTRMLILNTPNNPTGRVLSEADAATVKNIALAHGLLIISDEIYEKVIFDGNKHISLGAVEGLEDRVITVNGFSKCAAMTGWRVGYLAAEKSIVDKIYMMYQHTMTCISGFIQKAATVALDCTDDFETMRKSYEARRNFFVERMKDVPAVECNVPEGSFYAWLNISYRGMNDREMANFLLEEARVVVVPGSAYGENDACFVRVSLATAMADLETAAERIKAALSK